MFACTAVDIKDTFASSKNNNAAAKSLLKREGRATPGLERFVKDFRAVATKPDSMAQFIDRAFPEYESFLLALARYAHSECFDTIANGVIEKHAETFNGTYDKVSDGIKVTDRKGFDTIVEDVLKTIDANLKDAQIPVNNFTRKTALMCIFDPEVLTEIMRSQS